MQATANPVAQRIDADQARARALVRFNGMAFHSLAAASFLETAVDLQVDRVIAVFGGRPDVVVWLEHVWRPRRADLGRRLRELIESVWPEFDWVAAYQEFHDESGARAARGPRHARETLEALELCVVSAQAAVFYRSLFRSADLPALRALAEDAARDYAHYFDFFSGVYERCGRGARLGFAAAWRASAASCRSAREGGVADAYRPLERNWKGMAIVPAIDYADFCDRMAALIQRHAGLGPIERLLFRPWLTRERATQPSRPDALQWLQQGPQAA